MRPTEGATTMKALLRYRYGSPDVLAKAEIDRPVPGDDEVLVRVMASSLNMADLDHLEGRPLLARIGNGLLTPKRPSLGLDVAGRVEAVGRGVTKFQPGDEVWADRFGSYDAFAEYVCGSASSFAPKPTTMTFEQAATMPHSAVLAHQALAGGGSIQADDKILIIGAGGCVGPFAIQIAKSFGAEVTGVDHAGKLGLMRSVGADHVIDYTREDFARSGQSYDLIVDIAEAGSVLRYRRSLTERGRYVLIARSLSGFFGAFFFGGILSLVSSKRLGVFMWRPNHQPDLEFLSRLFDSGKLLPVIDSTIGLDDVPAALRYLEEGQARGKVVVTI